MPKHFGAHLALLVANLIYGLNYSIAKDVMEFKIEPFAFVCLRVSGTIFLIWTVAALFKREKTDTKDLFRLLLCGIFGVGLNQLLFFWGLSLTSPINSSIIMVCTPILVFVLAGLLIKEPFHSTRITGIFIGLTGAIVLLLVKPASVKSGNLLGDFVTFINACSYGFYLVLVKPLMNKYHPVTVMKWIFLFGLFPLLLAGSLSLVIPGMPFSFNEIGDIQWDTFTTGDYSAVAFVIIGTTFFAYLLNTYGLVRLSPSIVSAYIYLQPALSAFFAILLGKDHLDGIKIISCTLIVVGVYLVSKPINEHRKPLPE